MSIATLPISRPITRRWTRDEYYKLAEDGWFEGQRVQLIAGEIIQMPSMKSPHAYTLMKVDQWARSVFGSNHVIRAQMPLHASEDSEPEPDIAILAGPMEAYRNEHPRTAIFVIEIADSSVDLDRRKASLYAATEVQEYWIINIPAQCIEVHRKPVPDKQAEFGSCYDNVEVITMDQSIAPLAMPQAIVKVSDLLP